MSEEKNLKLNIHFGGNMVKTTDSYVYADEFSWKTKIWKLSEITWKRFENFLREEKMKTDLSLIWFKDAQEEMKNLRYAFEDHMDQIVELQSVGITSSEIDVFLEQECLISIPNPINLLTSSQHEDQSGGGYESDSEEREREEYETGGGNEVDREGDSEDDGADIPREEEEGEQSEDEQPVEDKDEHQYEEVLQENINANQNPDDDGEDVVLDAGDGAKDKRFKSVFEEGAKTAADFTASNLRMNEEKKDEAREAEESEEEDRLGDVQYPDTPLSSDEKWDQWMSKGTRKKKAQFHGDLDKEPYIWLFQKFNSGLEFKDQLLRYSLNTQYDVKMAKSEANRIAAVCCSPKCPWRVYCSVEVPLNKWMVKVCHYKHNHEKSSRVSMLKQGVIAGLFREELRRNVNMQAAEIKDIIKARYNIVVPLSKCYRGRRIALNSVIEAHSIQFGKLWDYEAELRRTHEGIITELNTTLINDVPIFDCFYICFKELRETWKKCCRPVIGLDGCFLKWELTGDVLSAVGRDADNRMYPIAWAVVKGENKDTWGWFVRRLKIDLGLGVGDNLTIISDKQKGLVIAIADELPKAEHRMCARHIYANWKKSFSRSEYKNLFWGVAYSYNTGEYDEKMLMVKSYDPAAHEALLATDPEKWCRAFFSTDSRCPDVHNNLSESFNRTIKIARSKPVLTLLEDIRRQAMRRISRRYLKAERCDTILTPTTMALLEKSRIDNKYFSTIRSSSTVYEVNEFTHGYKVSLSTHECACRRWDLSGIPCRHAICVMDDNRDDPVKYVSGYYYASVMKETYADNIKPVNGEKLWMKTWKTPIGIPEFRKPRGRPKNRDRRKEPFEDLKNLGKSTRHGRTPRCSNCLQTGHIKSGCKNEKVVVEGPKNRRGRPCKLPSQVPKRPTKPRKRKSPASVTSSQPIPASESTSEYPTTSSAPQPETSATAVPQFKKPKRGRPLKVTKSGPIPRGVGILRCPYTDRVFEVINNRAYDTSVPPPEPPS